MITLTIDNSYSNISGLSPEQEKELRNALSYVVGGKSAYYNRFGARRKSLIDKHGNFPTGLIPRLPYLPIEEVRRTVAPKRAAHPCGAFAYDWQRTALEITKAWDRGIITAPTGTGKSMLIQMICDHFGLKTLVVVPTLEIKKQLQEGALAGLSNVVVENIDSKALNSLTGFDCLIIDEAHHVAAKTYHKLNRTAWKGIYYRYFLTATPFRNDNEEQLLFESIAGQVIYQLTYKEAVSKKYIVPIEAYYIDLPKQETDAFTYKQVYNELVVNHEHRNNVIAALLLRLNAVKASTLCLVREVFHGAILCQLTGVPFVSGKEEVSRQYIKPFNAGDIKSLIGTTGILGEGVDTKPCEYVIIAGLGKAKSQFLQQIGRAVRKYPGKESAKIILFRDRSHKFTLRHYNAQVKILKELGIKPMKLEI